MFGQHVTIVVCVVSVLLAQLEGLTVDKSKVENEWTQQFKHHFETFSDRVLEVSQIENMLKATDLIQPLDGGKEYERIFDSIQTRYGELIQAVRHIKQAVEDPIPSPPVLGDSGGPPPIGPGVPPPVTQTFCCHNNLPKRYEGRYRQEIFEGECYESVDDELKKLVTSDFISVMKDNYKSYKESVTWQYFADTKGRYVQYPANGRLCDNTSRVDSPLIQEWFVEKLHMETKNLVIVFDAGSATNHALPSGPPGTNRRHLIEDAVTRTLGTLTSQDKVNLVSMSPGPTSNVTVPAQCKDTLFIADPRNVDLLKVFTKTLSESHGEPDIMTGLSTAYSLLRGDMNENKVTFNKASNMILLVLDGTSKPTGWSDLPILEMVAKQQKLLSNSVQHFVFTLGSPVIAGIADRLAQLADQNRLKLNTSGITAKPWTNIPSLVTAGQPVGKEGTLDIVLTETDLPSVVSNYFQRLPQQVDTELTTIVPTLDTYSGITMTVAIPVYNDTSRGTVVGVAAVDATLAVIFSDVVNFDFGVHSYSFLLESRHGRPLLHPKLRDPDDTSYDDTTFPPIELLEPDLSVTERDQLLAADNTKRTLTVSIRPGRNSFGAESGLLLSREPATLHYRRLSDTSLVVVMVHFNTDKEEETVGNKQVVPGLHAPYHRLDQLILAPVHNKPDRSNVCRLDGHFLSFTESVIKLSPGVFKIPELYKYTSESVADILSLNNFLVNGDPSALIREDIQNEIKRVVERTDGLDTLWKTSSREVIARFYGAPSGVFRMFPGIPMKNTFDHINAQWYKRSVTDAGHHVFQRTKFGWISQNDVIIVSKALASQTKVVNGVTVPERLEGVVAMTITPSFLTSQLIKVAPDCLSKDTQCHLVDRSGLILDSIYEGSTTKDRYITSAYPWLAQQLREKSLLQERWCTGMSDGYHKQDLNIADDARADRSSGEMCKQYVLAPVTSTNLFVLVLANRKTYNCREDTETCDSCSSPTSSPRFKQPLGRCQHCVTGNSTRCQCSCLCDVDYDQCRSQYERPTTGFPTEACYYPPSEVSSQQLQPDPPGPMHGLQSCQTPCVSVEDPDTCSRLPHCKMSTDRYPVCIWDDPLTTTTLPVKSTPTGPIAPPTLGGRTTVKVPPGISQSALPQPPGVLKTTADVPPVPGISPSLHTTAVSHSPAITSTGPHTSETKNPDGTSQSKQGGPENSGMSAGAIAGIVISVLVVGGGVTFLVIKIYGKKFRRPGDAGTLDRYLTGSGMFDSALFTRSQGTPDSVMAPASTVPYQGMAANGGELT